MEVTRDVWPRLYRQRWHKRDVHPDTFSHPAKFQPTLIRRIYEHAFAEGWLHAGTRTVPNYPGSIILDPFGGVGLGAYYALTMGLTWIGVELEPKHAATGQANIATWKRRFATMPTMGDAVLLCGDSTKLLTWGRLEPNRGADLIASSPPYVQALGHDPGRDREIDQQKSLAMARGKAAYGNTEGNLSQMREGSLDACLSSPPYAQSLNSERDGIDDSKMIHERGKRSYQKHGNLTDPQKYGPSPANLAALPEGSLAGVLGSDCVVNGEKHEKLSSKRRRNVRTVPNDVYGADRGKIRDVPPGDPEGVVPRRTSQEAPFRGGKTCHTTGQKGGSDNFRSGALDVEGRALDSSLPSQSEEGIVLGMPVEDELGHPPQGFRSLQRLPGESSSALPLVPHEPSQDGILGGEATGQVSSEIERSARVDTDPSCIISSPPYEGSIGEKPSSGLLAGSGGRMGQSQKGDGYEKVDNLGNQSGDTFWAASRTILENCFHLLKPGGHAIWVCGPYVRKGKLVDFPMQWADLCESIGFTLEHVHRCPKVEHYGTQRTLDGEDKHDTVERVSFFRRLANAKGGAKVDYEDVLCLEKPSCA